MAGDRWSIFHICPMRSYAGSAVHLLTMLRQTLRTEAIAQLVDRGFRQYPDGLVTNVQRGMSLRSHRVCALRAKYVVSPPIAVRRIDRYDGARSRTTTAPTAPTGWSTKPSRSTRLLPHGAAHDSQRVQAHPVLWRTGHQDVCQGQGGHSSGPAKVEEVVKGAVKIIARLTYRQRYEQSTGAIPSGVPIVRERWSCGTSAPDLRSDL